MYRDPIRGCPACATPMIKETVETADATTTVDRCHQCGGAFFDYFDGEPGTLARALSSDEESSSSRQPQSGDLECPDCHRVLDVHAYLGGPPIHRCTLCMAVFATEPMLEALADYFESERKEDGSTLGRFVRRLLGYDRLI